MSDSSQERFERQLQAEDNYRREGAVKKLRKDHANKQKNFGSHTEIGRILRRELIGIVAHCLKRDYKTRIMQGHPGNGFVNIYGLFEGRVRWDVIAHIGLSTILDYVCVPKTPIHVVHRKIGERIEDELRMHFYRASDPELFKKCKRDYLRATASYHQKIYSTSKVFRDAVREIADSGDRETADLKTWHKWPQPALMCVGSWIVSTCHLSFITATEGTPLLVRRNIQGDGHREVAYAFSDEVLDIEQIQHELAMKQATYMEHPMVCPPIDWVMPCDQFPEGVSGGFITNAMTRRYDLVRRGTSIPSQTAVDALNRLQQVAWQINPFVFEVVQHFYQRGLSINEADSFKPYLRPEERDIPKLPPELINIPHPRTATTLEEKRELMRRQKVQKEEKRKLRDWHNKDADRRKAGEIFRQVMAAAYKFKDEERFWIPWSFDFRTRMYPINTVNPQSAEYASALLQFADGHPLDEKSEYWLSIHLATTKGHSKETFSGREAWVAGNYYEIMCVAVDPLGIGLRYWTEDADEPWMYLSACREFYQCFLAGKEKHRRLFERIGLTVEETIPDIKTETHVLCGIDATASGLQIIGGLMGDESTCELVNVIPTKKPSDLYQAVLDKAIKLIKEAKDRKRIPLDQLTRKVAKAPVMTRAYGSTAWTRKGQVADACNSKRGLDLDIKWENIAYLSEKIDEAVKLVLPGVDFVLDWLQRVAVTAIERDPEKKTINWATPSGCLIIQSYLTDELKRVRSYALGGSRYYTPRVNVKTDEVAENKVESSTAANVVHSCDASIIHIAVAKCDFPISMTHDCGYARAGKDMELLNKALHQAFVNVVSFEVLESFATINGVEDMVEEVSVKKNHKFDRSDALKSDYLFC